MLQDDIGYATILFSGKTNKERMEKTLQFADEIEKESNIALKVTPTGFPKINKEINERTQNDLKSSRDDWITNCVSCITIFVW